jgi:hypothetical protein
VTSEITIDGLGNANGEALDAPSQTRSVLGLDQEMDMIRLDAEVDDAEGVARSGSQSAPARDEDSVRTQGGQGVGRPQCDVHGAAGIVGFTRPMQHRAAAGAALATGTGPATTPRADQLQLSCRWSHCD